MEEEAKDNAFVAAEDEDIDARDGEEVNVNDCIDLSDDGGLHCVIGSSEVETGISGADLEAPRGTPPGYFESTEETLEGTCSSRLLGRFRDLFTPETSGNGGAVDFRAPLFESLAGICSD